MVNVKLLKGIEAKPINLALGAARSCYSNNLVTIDDEYAYVGDKVILRKEETLEGIRSSTLKAGHNTTRQHASFTFLLDGVSRQAIWSFLHSHPFYNSEQVSQRYVAMKSGNFTVPESFTDEQRVIFEDTVNSSFAAYTTLNELLRADVKAAYFSRFPARRKQEGNWDSAIGKKVQEISRYILPVATHAHLYHTVSVLTLMRMNQVADLFNIPAEQRQIVNRMVDLVCQEDHDFRKDLEDLVIYDLESSPEFRIMKLHQDMNVSRKFKEGFDQALDGRVSKLTDYSVNGERSLANAVRAVLQVPESKLSDEQALDYLLNPALHPAVAETNNVNTLTKLGSALTAVNYSFQKKLSHSGDSQNQRHRMTPGVAPIFVVGEEPDLVLPELIKENEQVKEYFLQEAGKAWGAMNRLREMGATEDAVQYLAPNAIAVRLIESGNLRDLHHKYRMRLCLNAQEEIWRASEDEVEQITAVHPIIGKYLQPPCVLRKMADAKPACPEGARYCGVPVWK